MDLLLIFSFVSSRVNGKLVALKVIRLQEEEGTPFTAIREGRHFLFSLLLCLHNVHSCLHITQLWIGFVFLNSMPISLLGVCKLEFEGQHLLPSYEVMLNKTVAPRCILMCGKEAVALLQDNKVSSCISEIFEVRFQNF